MTNNNDDRVPGLDVLRAVAICLVFIFHFQNQGGIPLLTRIAPYGWSGVDLFFVLSGYLIATQFFKTPTSLKIFYLRRALRILPAYLVVAALYYCLPLFNEGNGLPPLWKFLTFTQNFGLDQHSEGGFSHAWSLCVEEHFYLVFPVLVLMVRRINQKIVYILVPLLFGLLAILLRFWIWVPNMDNNLWAKLIYYPTYTHFDGLLIGVSVAMILTYGKEFKQKLERVPNLPAICGFFISLLGLWVSTNKLGLLSSLLSFSIVSLGFGGIVMSASSPSSLLNRIPAPGAKLLATLSYSFYLLHKAIIHMMYPLLSSIPDRNLKAVIIFFICLAGAGVLHVCVEKPFLKLRSHIMPE